MTPLERSDDRDLEESTLRWMRWGAVLLFAFALAFPAYRAVEPERRAEARERQMENLTAQGDDLFSTSCAECHGADGGGGTAPALRSEQFLAEANDHQIEQLIAVGVPGSQMASYSIDHGGILTQSQIEAIVVYLRSQEEDAPDFPDWRFPLAQEGLTGRELYNLACAGCHGVDLSGDEEEDIPDLGPGSDATEESDPRLTKQIREGEDEMPSFGGTLTDDQIQLIIEYLREVQEGD